MLLCAVLTFSFSFFAGLLGWLIVDPVMVRLSRMDQTSQLETTDPLGPCPFSFLESRVRLK